MNDCIPQIAVHLFPWWVVFKLDVVVNEFFKPGGVMQFKFEMPDVPQLAMKRVPKVKVGIGKPTSPFYLANRTDQYRLTTQKANLSGSTTTPAASRLFFAASDL